MEPFDAVIHYLREGRAGALATIVSRVGATPREVGAKIFIGDDGKIFGTVGGGCMEAEVWQHSRVVLTKGESTNLRYALDGRAVEDEGMICGGTVEFFLEPVIARHKEIYEKIFACLSGDGRAIVITSTGKPPFQKCLIVEGGEKLGDVALDITGQFEEVFSLPSPTLRDGCLIETVAPPSHLFIYGAGHISQHISRIAKAVGFRVTVMDDRKSFANRDRFPEADKIIVGEFVDIPKKMWFHGSGYAVIVTRGHKHDAAVLEGVLKRPPRYVGMIGSKRKVKIIFDNLRKKGIGENFLQSVYAPIGIDIGAETPQEIAVSIVAQLIKIRSNYS